MLCLAEVATHTRHIEEQAHVDVETLQGQGGRDVIHLEGGERYTKGQ